MTWYPGRVISDDDPIALRLREAVWSDPEPDAPRMVYADYLLEHGDPLGELIALQLERARTAGQVTTQELALVETQGRRMLTPLQAELSMVDHWRQDWELSRGFLAVAEALGAMPAAAAHHPMWATVEKVVVRDVDHPIFDNPHLRARALQAYDAVHLALARRTAPLPFRTLSGTGAHGGLSFAADRLDVIDHAGAFDHVRALRANGRALEGALEVRPVLESRLFAQLEHLDLTFGGWGEDLTSWRQRWDATQIARFSVHVPLYITSEPGELDESISRGGNPTHYLYVEIDRASDQVVIQLDQATGSYHLSGALAVIAAVAPDRARIVVEDLSDRRRSWNQHVEPFHDATRTKDAHPELLEALCSRFADVSVTERAMPRRAP